MSNAALNLSESEQVLIFDSVPNELINGSRLSNFNRHVGISLIEYTDLLKKFRRDDERRKRLNNKEAAILRNALDAVLRKLGEDEFQTRTGIDYSDGCELLKRFDAYLQASAPDDVGIFSRELHLGSAMAENKGIR